MFHVKQREKRMTIKNVKDCSIIAEHYGKEAQHRQLAEECAELAQASLKCIRNNYDEKSLDHLIEEMADVLIMIAQCLFLNDIEAKELDMKVSDKIERQLKRIEQETERGENE